ncbi:hypothetical protein MBELCI_1778 [Limimaricola cinnabarinus LL-001]|uniref:Uncharacterized protein n=1 Tax=Limimaricola cinnabarinus LL-001 TaxID=1337093 RepID=U2YL14_9RHOB|nr:hypothetical protein MBELCI_1778 [Limimaricola cinnabarinus LL-001]
MAAAQRSNRGAEGGPERGNGVTGVERPSDNASRLGSGAAFSSGTT